MAEDVATFVQDHRLHDVTLIGHSMYVCHWIDGQLSQR